MVYIKAVWQFDKTHNVNSFLALICGRASLKYIFLFICGLLIVFFTFFVLFCSKKGKSNMGLKSSLCFRF